jgi:hypothetical protein
MKHKICISVDEETILKVRESIRKGIYRNKSHAFESAFNKVVEE